MQVLPQNTSQVPDDQTKDIQSEFNGSWLPDVHELQVPQGNYSDVQNIVFTKTGIIMTNGYTPINSTPIATYIKGRAGIQLRSPNLIGGVKSYIITQQLNTGLSASQLFLNTTLPPATGDFVGTALHTEATGFGQGYFTEAPGNQIIYCNGKETLIYGGDEVLVAGFITADSITGLTPVNPINKTNEILSVSSAVDKRVTLAAGKVYLVGTSRPVSALKNYFYTGNVVAGTCTVKYWNGSAWTAVTNLVDGTISAGCTHAVNGSISFDSTVGLAKPSYICDQLIYWYLVEPSAGVTSVVYHTTVNPPLQNLIDLWDGINRACIQLQRKRDAKYEDYTAEVYDVSNSTYPIAADLSGLTSSEEVIFIFSEQITALRFAFIAKLSNIKASDATISYWNGSAYTSVGTLYDGTSTGGTKTLGQSGVIYWQAPATTAELKQNLFGVYGYAYKLTVSNTLTTKGTDAGVFVDTVYGIPVPKTMGVYKLAFQYKNRVFLAGDIDNGAGNALDCGTINTADCYNGPDSAIAARRMYVGNASSEIVGSANVFNRFGTNLYNTEIILKPTETFILDGEAPTGTLPFRINQISENIGAASARSITTAEVAFEVTKEAVRNIALWISAVGPMLFDAAILSPIPGIDCYFDKSDSRCVNFSALFNSHTYFDPNTFLWNVFLPSGVGQVTCNVWLTYSLVLKRWAKVNTSTTLIPQATVKTVDAYGNIYFYGLLDDGTMVRLDNGALWNGTTPIEGFLTTGAMLPTNNIYQTSALTLLKYVIEASSTPDVTYTRTDMEINGQRIDRGELDVYDEFIEDELCEASYFEGNIFYCKELIEEATLGGGLLYQDVLGVVSIVGVVVEGYVTNITTAAGNFLTAGFVDSAIITTSDINNQGPTQCGVVTAAKITLPNLFVYINFVTGTSLTITSSFIIVEHINAVTGVATKLVFTEIDSFLHFKIYTVKCDILGLSHKLKFYFYSNATGSNMKPIAWGARFLIQQTE